MIQIESALRPLDGRSGVTLAKRDGCEPQAWQFASRREGPLRLHLRGGLVELGKRNQCGSIGVMEKRGVGVTVQQDFELRESFVVFALLQKHRNASRGADQLCLGGAGLVGKLRSPKQCQA